MTEYIQREAIGEEIRKYYYKNPPNFSYGEGFDRGLDRAQRAILDAPAADVVQVRHGRWIHTDLAAHWLGKDECSECTYHERDRRDLSHFNYCPNCGATMDGCDGNSDMA